MESRLTFILILAPLVMGIWVVMYCTALTMVRLTLMHFYPSAFLIYSLNSFSFSYLCFYMHFIYISFSLLTVYKCRNWSLSGTSCKTNIASNTLARAPGTVYTNMHMHFVLISAFVFKFYWQLSYSIGYLPAIFIIESIMDNVACTIGMDVEQFKQTNLYKKGDISYIVRREERERE